MFISFLCNVVIFVANPPLPHVELPRPDVDENIVSLAHVQLTSP